MKIDRLLGILTILLQHDKVTAPELALKFEVSRRTIHRDIDDICKAGIPVITYQGGDGGISIAKGYKLDKSLLSVNELQSIITGLKSIGSVTDNLAIDNLISKLSPNHKEEKLVKDDIIIDLASHYKNSLSEKIDLFKLAISNKNLVTFDYYSEKGVSTRKIEPYFITFKWSAWYVCGFCCEKEGFRLFKLNRLWELKLNSKSFVPRDIPLEKDNLDNYFEDNYNIKVLFDNSVKFILVEEYGPNSFEEVEGGKLLFSVGFTNKEYMLRWILSFGDKAKVLEPKEFKEEVYKRAKNITSFYEHDI